MGIPQSYPEDEALRRQALVDRLRSHIGELAPVCSLPLDRWNEIAFDLYEAADILVAPQPATVAQGVVSRGVSWSEEDYKHARDCMIGLLRGRAWTISEGSRGVDEFDNAFQHAVGILALTASPLASTDRGGK